LEVNILAKEDNFDMNDLNDIIEYMPDAFACHKIVTDTDGTAIDYTFIKVNKAFEDIVGIKREDIIGKNVTEIMPAIKNSEFDWIKVYSQVAFSGESNSFKQYSAPLNKWFDISAFSEKRGYFNTIFREVTKDVDQKRALELIVNISEICFKSFGESYVYDKIADTVQTISGAFAVGFNIYEKDGKSFKTVALSGSLNKIKKVVEALGFNPVDKKWEHDSKRDFLIKNNEITEFEDLTELVGDKLPKNAIRFLEKIFSTGKAYVAKIIKSDIMIGDFTIMMPKGKSLENFERIKILSGLTGQYIERIRSQRDLVLKTEELEGFFEVNLDLLCIADTDGNFIRINKAWSEVLGYSEQEILERKFFDFIHPDDLKSTLETVATLKKQKQVINFINRYKTKDGEYRHIEWRSNPQGKVIYAAARDITEQRIAQEQLISEHNKLITIFDDMEAIVYVVDMDTYEVLYINNHGVLELGNLTGEICWKKIHPESSGVCEFCPIKNLRNQKTELYERSHREYYNEVSNKWYQCTDSVITWTDGRDVKLTVSLDITNRVKLEQERFIEQEKFKITLLSVGDGVIATDNKGIITVMNKVAEDLSGWTYQEACGKPLEQVFNIIHERTKKPCDNPAKQVLLTGETLELENHTALVTKTGEIISVEDSAAPIKNIDGKITGVVIVFRDYTHKREQLERVEFLSFNDHLTGLYNRRFMEDALIKIDKAENLPITITVVDVNGLKLTNDAYGHEMGDKLLITVAKLLKEVTNEKDIVARTGGDEFVILHPKMDESEALDFKFRLKELYSKVKLESVIVSLAVGYDVKSEIFQDIHEVMRQADNRMYKDKLKSGKYMRSKTIETVLRNINNKYDSEQIHTENVSNMCAALAREIGLSKIQIDDIKKVAALHDIGKTVISPDLLNKKEKLTNSEISEIKRHPVIGYNILKGVDEYANYADAVLYHHERWDGKGYPSGLQGEKIPLYSRIVAVADSYEEMTSKRPYQNIKTKQEAIDELRRCSGTQFDPEIVKIFLEKVL